MSSGRVGRGSAEIGAEKVAREVEQMSYRLAFAEPPHYPQTRSEPPRTAPNQGAEAARWEAAARLCYFFHRRRGFAPRPAATDAMANKENSPMPALRSASAALDVPARAARDVLYPCSDGRPMADNAWQSRAIVKAAGDLEVAHPDALAVADILVYPEEGNPRNRIAPDVLVAFGVGTHSRSSYLVWEEGKPPDWVLEVASPSTASKDLDFKRRAYAAMGVPEYWLFDPKGDVFPAGQPQLQGLALSGGGYARLAPRRADGVTMIRSGVLGLDLRVEGEFIRMRDPATRKDILHQGELTALAEREAEHAQREAARRKGAETHAERETARRKGAEAHAEREAARRKDAEARAKQEAERAEREAERAEREAERAQREAAERLVAQARVAELEAALQGAEERALRRLRAGSTNDQP